MPATADTAMRCNLSRPLQQERIQRSVFAGERDEDEPEAETIVAGLPQQRND